MILGRNIVSREDAVWGLERFGWLIENFCPKYGPLRASLTCIKDGELSLDHYSAQTNALDWAMACFETIRYQAGMQHWPISFVARDKSLPKRANDSELPELSGHSGNEDRYYTDELGRPIIYFEPKRIEEPGYITHRAAAMLSGILHRSVEKPADIRKDSNARITAVTAAFLGLGLPIASRGRNKNVIPFNGEPKVLDASCRRPGAESIFACAIFLSVKGCDGARAKRLYTTLIDDDIMSDLQDAFAQLRHYKNDISRLRNLAMTTEQKDMIASA